MLNDSEHFKKNIELLAKAEILLDLVHVAANALAIDRGVSRRRLEYSSKHVNRCRLTCAIVTQNRENLSFLYRQA